MLRCTIRVVTNRNTAWWTMGGFYHRLLPFMQSNHNIMPRETAYMFNFNLSKEKGKG